MSGGLNGRISEKALRLALRVRREAVELARQGLLAAIDQAEAARRIERAAIAALDAEANAATSLQADDLAVEAFAAWLPAGRFAVAAARSRRDDAESRVALARAVLATARAAEAATEALLDQQGRARVRRQARVEQAAIDEAACRGPRSPDAEGRSRPV